MWVETQYVVVCLILKCTQVEVGLSENQKRSGQANCPKWGKTGIWLIHNLLTIICQKFKHAPYQHHFYLNKSGTFLQNSAVFF